MLCRKAGSRKKQGLGMFSKTKQLVRKLGALKDGINIWVGRTKAKKSEKYEAFKRKVVDIDTIVEVLGMDDEWVKEWARVIS